MRYVILALLMMAGSLSCDAQRRKAKAPKLTEEEMRQQERLERMTEATQRIVVVDSIVVDKDAFLSAINMPSEGGTITKSADFLGGAEDYTDTYAHINQMGTRCYYARADVSGNTRLYRSDNYDGKWSAGTAVKGLEGFEGAAQPNYPYMMADGMTMYFAAKGEESIGGLDIFVTRYNPDDDEFFKPENIGMPFNSTANDYMYAVDEYDNIGWFVSDRSQPAGKVCVYIFIPEYSHATYNTDEYTEEQMKGLAAIASIADTWGDGSAKDAALQRLAAIETRLTGENTTVGKEIEFVVNDNVVYTHYSDFQSDDNAERYAQLLEMEKQKTALDASIERNRDYYSKADEQLKEELGHDILEKEKESESLAKKIRQMTKEIRNSENTLLLM